MAKIIFMNELWWELIGIMQLSSVLKQGSHEVLLYMYKKENKKLLKFIKDKDPDCIAFSLMTGQHNNAVKISSFIKKNIKKPILTIFGGHHCTFKPEIINNDSVDIVVRGEGEGALFDIMNAIDNRTDMSGIDNVWIKQGSNVIKNKLRPLIDNLDDLPFPDRSIFDNYYYFRSMTNRLVMASRGCPFSCAMCFNKQYRQLYKEKGSVKNCVRMRSVENVISEIKHIKKEYPKTKLIKFIDDNLTLDQKWLFNFLKIYRKEIGIPFTCLARPDIKNEEIIKVLAESGCVGVELGIETGNEKLRNEVLNKSLKNKQIIDTTSLLKKYKLPFVAYTIFFIPNGTLKNAWETIEINQKISPDSTRGHIFNPYPGTKLYDQMINDKIIGKDYWDKPDDMFKFPEYNACEDVNAEKKIYYLSNFLIRYPSLTPFFKKLIRIVKIGTPYIIIFKVSVGIDAMLRNKLTFYRFLIEIMYHFKFN